MSIRLMNETMDTDLSVSSKMVMMVLCDFADDSGRNCWPSIATIAAKASLSERQTQRVMGELRGQQLIAITGNTAAGGRSTTCRYVINTQKLGAMAVAGRAVREQAIEQKGDNMSPFPPVDKDAQVCGQPVGDLSKRVTFATERVTFATQKGDTHVTQSVIYKESSLQEVRSVDNSAPDSGSADLNGEALREFPVSWQPCETCKAILKARNVDWPQPHVIDAFAAHWAGKWLPPRRIPNEFLKWVSRERGMTARFTPKVAEKGVSEEAMRAWDEVRAANQRDELPSNGWSDPRIKPALDAIGGFGLLRDMKTSDVPFRMKDFVAAFCMEKKRA